jgi:hypothetical protein
VVQIRRVTRPGAPTNNVARVLRRSLERAGIARLNEAGEKLDLHALRHSAATQWARRGVPIVHAQALLGHSDVRLTSRVYTHVAVEDLRGRWMVWALAESASVRVPALQRWAEASWHRVERAPMNRGMRHAAATKALSLDVCSPTAQAAPGALLPRRSLDSARRSWRPLEPTADCVRH